MSATWLKRLVGLVVVVLVIAAALWALRPQPVQVDMATVEESPLAVYVEEEGTTRIKDIFSVSAPVAGQIDRFPLEVGDTVEGGKTVVAAIRPAAPSFLDTRTRRELEAAVEAAQAGVDLALAEMAAAEAADDLASSNVERAQRLAEGGTISDRALLEAEIAAQTATARLAQAAATLKLRQSELASAKARLIEPGGDGDENGDQCCVAITAPVDGVILDVFTESEQVIAAGTALLEIGDPSNLEIAVELLSQDAVQVEPGAHAEIFDWGGVGTIAATVRRIDPAAFTKVSALGIEEQRVNAVLDLDGSADAWHRLGHEFRVMVRINVWETDNTVLVPLAALFRSAGSWQVFRVVDGRAALTDIAIDHRDDSRAEVLSGLAAGDRVILHPSDRITDGAAVELRASSGAE